MENKGECYPYLSWTAIFSAAIIGVGLNFLLNLFSLGLGISSFSIDLQGKTSLSFAGFICFCISSIIAMFFTGWFAGKLSPPMLQGRLWGAFYGFLAWSLLLIITVLIITNMIQFLAFHSNFTSNLVSVKLTHSAPMLTETIAHITKSSPLSFNIETTKKVLTLNAMLTFILFFLGALSSCIGGFIGYKK
ncbi:hypothetical protein [Legionella clemsonensis]|uniref:DUF4199 domain-containing protein n=1 Tax=Legionella clemsonensis TaxID=1867846 RepID=A0A222P157_9GAMM|nr:hypothetical protein [Legionella clemsonensis]ASQ45598.1 hypothetical protein clem_05210 [Legionella clemsonensis]